jgi:hypothetical protein
MCCDFDPHEEEAFDRLVKRLLSEEWERFPAPGARVWRDLSARLGCQANVGTGGNEATTSLDEVVRGNNGGDAQDDNTVATPPTGSAEMVVA